MTGKRDNWFRFCFSRCSLCRCNHLSIKTRPKGRKQRRALSNMCTVRTDAKRRGRRRRRRRGSARAREREIELGTSCTEGKELFFLSVLPFFFFLCIFFDNSSLSFDAMTVASTAYVYVIRRLVWLLRSSLTERKENKWQRVSLDVFALVCSVAHVEQLWTTCRWLSFSDDHFFFLRALSEYLQVLPRQTDRQTEVDDERQTQRHWHYSMPSCVLMIASLRKWYLSQS